MVAPDQVRKQIQWPANALLEHTRNVFASFALRLSRKKLILIGGLAEIQRINCL